MWEPTDLVSYEDIELEHPFSPLADLDFNPLPLPDGRRLEGVVCRQPHKQLDAELMETIDNRHL